nr:hypothetical protein [Phenylobacterium sp.]
MASISISARIHCGAWGSQKRIRSAPAMASSATTITQKYQYIHPVRNPAKSPKALRAYS